MLAVLVVGGAGAVPAPADTPPPIPAPSGFPSSGPTYVITPGVGGSELPAPSDEKAVEKAKQADQQAAHQTHPTHRTRRTKAGPPPHQPPTHAAGEVAGPQTPLTAGAAPTRTVGLLVRGFAALVAMVVMFEIVAVRRHLFGARRRAVTAG